MPPERKYCSAVSSLTRDQAIYSTIAEIVPPPLHGTQKPLLTQFSAPPVLQKGEEGSEEVEFLEDFLKSFSFKEGVACPISCLDIERVIYGHRVGYSHVPRRLEIKSHELPQVPELDAFIDVDSVLWNLDYIPAQDPIHIFPNPHQGSNIVGNHQFVPKVDQAGRVPMSRTPHCLFGKTRGTITIHAIFPSLSPKYLPPGQDYLPTPLLDLWYESVVLPACRRFLGPNRLQHLRPTARNARDYDKKGMIGHILQPLEVNGVTREMRSIVNQDDHLQSHFNGFFFHAACKGVKGGTVVPYRELLNPEGLRSWKDTVMRRYAGAFGDEGMKGMQVDIAVEFMPSEVAIAAHGPIHLLWKREGCLKMKTGMNLKPKLAEWWLTKDVTGMTVGPGGRDVVEVGKEHPDPAYAQVYQVDKELISGARDHWMSRLQWHDMKWSNMKMKDAWKVLIGGLEDGRMMSWGSRYEQRITGDRFLRVDGLEEFMNECEAVKANHQEYFIALPSLTAARFQASCLWIVRDGAERVDRALERKGLPPDPSTESFMRLLASLFRGFYRGKYFSYDRRSLNLGKSIETFGWIYTTHDKVIWLSVWALPCRSVIQEEEEGRLDRDDVVGEEEESVVGRDSSSGDEAGREETLNSLIGEQEMRDLMGGDYDKEVERSVLLTPEVIAGLIIKLLRQDLINAAKDFADTRIITEWNLEQVRQAIGHRQERHVSSRRKISSWWKLFRYLFPRPGQLRSHYVKPDLMQRHQRRLVKDAASKFDKELWLLFRRIDCMVRCSIRGMFAKALSGELFIDLRDQCNLSSGGDD
ncbi:hypothetical protein BJ684DRAFT_15582 [Piptocephalis cylindrospora]|uniref:Uncharacterized protein n=1 Tax=Piptocephalis cylindrospora TaxID=1907219 RepID=A0A4P9Y5I1_9FUNG|nr:hypothetical protein BJ684DRAFT_15582 [Piptocephalis cylindrospora]|eukprot:RKP14074.1 hypothetical protein BJ684DRAFT_15582 [Piptocephalis cylindrospora]